ncbi:alpha/beta hydrolase [Bifidobacterium myosotis]|uniref:Esterase n=1 Tax=Bifidobacterium myosotis TaxID=1630166 RepID=A0A5M9ZI07_9BIFI|nr:alpha/beta hydrolase-fold protein [Bifidobacterium myosotis]KAA8825575.1 esterase [Bifidobacterium myosotis]
MDDGERLGRADASTSADELIGRESTEVPGRFGEPLTVTHALVSRGGLGSHPTHPLFLCLHGWGSSEQDMADIMRLIAPYNDFVALRGPIILAEPTPSTDGRANGSSAPAPASSDARTDAGTGTYGMYEDRPGSRPEPGNYAWLHAAMPVGEDLDYDAHAAALAVDRWVADNIPADRDVVPLGFSQGGLVAVQLLRIHPERYRAVVSLSGFNAPGQVPGTAPADDRLADFDIPVFYTYGKLDGVIPKYELFATAAWLEEHTWLKTKSYHGLDHNVSLEEFADLRQWLLDNDITSGVL